LLLPLSYKEIFPAYLDFQVDLFYFGNKKPSIVFEIIKSSAFKRSHIHIYYGLKRLRIKKVQEAMLLLPKHNNANTNRVFCLHVSNCSLATFFPANLPS